MAYTFVYEARLSDGNTHRLEGKAETPIELLNEIDAISTGKAKVVEIASPDGRKLSVSDIQLFAEKGIIHY